MSSNPSHGRGNGQHHIETLDYRPRGRRLQPDDEADSSGGQSQDISHAGSFFEDVAEGVYQKDHTRKIHDITRYVSFVWAIINCLGAGSITAYSLYAPLFQQRLQYSQLQVNGVSITAELAMYLPVPLFGMLCDRTGPGIPSLLAGVFFGTGYLLAAFTYKSGPPPSAGGDGWPYWVMIIAFIGVGCGTSCMYLSAVTTCAKNFGRGKYKGLALALPIACFGLSGMWQAQVGSRLLYEQRLDGRKGDVDVHRFFLFLGIFLLATGVIGFFTLRVVDEGELIDEAIDELERSGLLEDSEFFRHHRHETYGAMSDDEHRLSDEELDEIRRKAEEETARLEEEQRKKAWLLNEETRRFLCDPTMWWMAAGFFLVTGPGEAFINNLGTIIGTLYPPVSIPEGGTVTSAATHVSIVAITSTAARIITGTLTDILAPTSPLHQHRRGPNSMPSSVASLPRLDHMSSGRLEVSRIAFLAVFCIIMSVGQVILASGVLQEHGNLFWLVSASIGAGYGAVFSLVPIIISVVWGVENFGTNWGIVATAPALGATIWSLVYSGVYQWAAKGDTSTFLRGKPTGGTDDVLCYGAMCYAPTFWAMALSVWVATGLFLWAWKGPGGWSRRGIAV